MERHADTDSFRRVWESFRRSDTTFDGRHDTPQWRAHGGPYAACVIRIPGELIHSPLREVRRHLAAVNGVRLHPDHFLHVMLQELGFVVDRPGRTDEISAARLEEFAQAATEPLSRIHPFPLALGAVNAFQDAVFLEARPAQPASTIHERLFDLAAIPQVPTYPYLPHCTIAHFDGTASPREVSSLLQPWRDRIFGEFPVSEVEIVTIDNKESYPALDPYAVIPLKT